MVSRENKVIVLFIALSLVTLSVVSEFVGQSMEVGAAVVLGVGVVLPTLINEYLDSKAS
jgi:hypothetical protein